LSADSGRGRDGDSQLGDGRRLGVIVSGSLSKGLEARLEPHVSVEDMAVGRYVVIDGRNRRFFGMITDVRLSSATPEIVVAPPDLSDPLLTEVMAGTSTFGTVEIATMLTIDHADVGSRLVGPQPVKTVPSHFAAVAEAGEADIGLVFGTEDETHFYIGKPLDMETKVCVDLKRLVARSSGVFGKSGTGKTFLTRLLLSGIVLKDVAVNLVFDMHSEYGWSGKADGSREVKGLKQLFNDRITVFTLDPKSSLDRGVAADHVVEIGYDQIEPEDFELLREALDMTQAQCESIHRLAAKGGASWLAGFAETDAQEREQMALAYGLNPGTLNVLHRKIERLARLPFLKQRAADDSVKRILETLQRGRHVVLEFGRHNSLDAYILVANILTRRIHERYVEMTDRGDGPRPLVITIEEAHKFLTPEVADLTIFGTIARELRKYNVTLLVVDQRPSQIDDEVLSQIGTRVTCLLDDERDIAAVLGGIPSAASLRSVLARLDSIQQAILLGHAVPMPVVIRTREYGPAFYAEVARGRFANGRAADRAPPSARSRRGDGPVRDAPAERPGAPDQPNGHAVGSIDGEDGEPDARERLREIERLFGD
jgi:DNA helicase HerA-like ATPase